MPKNRSVKEFKIFINEEPIGLNNAYPNKNFGGRRLSVQADIYKSIIFNHVIKKVRKAKIKLEVDPSKEFIEVEYLLGFQKAFTQGGKITSRKYDWDGHVKIFQDALFEALNLEDSFVLDVRVKKRGPDKISAAIIKIRPLSALEQ